MRVVAARSGAGLLVALAVHRQTALFGPVGARAALRGVAALGDAALEDLGADPVALLLTWRGSAARLDAA